MDCLGVGPIIIADYGLSRRRRDGGERAPVLRLRYLLADYLIVLRTGIKSVGCDGDYTHRRQNRAKGDEVPNTLFIHLRGCHGFILLRFDSAGCIVGGTSRLAMSFTLLESLRPSQ